MFTWQLLKSKEHINYTQIIQTLFLMPQKKWDSVPPELRFFVEHMYSSDLMDFLCICIVTQKKLTQAFQRLSGGPWANQLLPQEVRDANEKTDKIK